MKTNCLLAASIVLAIHAWVSPIRGQEAPRGHGYVPPPGSTVVELDAGHPLIVSAPATTVQLPTFNFFTVETTVQVPDRGSMSLGGTTTGASRSHTNGMPGLANTSRGSILSGGGTSVNAQIIDLQEMDRQLLSQSKPSPDAAAVNAWANRLEQARQSSAGRPALSVAEARQLRAADKR